MTITSSLYLTRHLYGFKLAGGRLQALAGTAHPRS